LQQVQYSTHQAQVWSQAPPALTPEQLQAATAYTRTLSEADKVSDSEAKKIVDKAVLLFGVNLPSGRESPTFIQNVTQLTKEGFDTPDIPQESP
jgi:hypothetical protein